MDEPGDGNGGALPSTMKAVQVDAFGGVDALQYREIAVPSPGAGQVLLRVSAAGVGPWDGWIRAGNSVLEQPLPLTPGSDVAGTVVRIGPGVTGWQTGDAAFGVTNPRFTNGYAQYALADVAMLAPMPTALDPLEAAAVPVIATTAWQMLFDYANVQRGQTVLIHGAAGNVGAFAVQLAALAGTHVIATASNDQADYVRSLGANEVVEARTGSFDAYTGRIDAVVDLVGQDAIDRSFELVKPGGVLVSAVTEPDKAKADARRLKAGFLLVAVNTAVLEKLADLLVNGGLKVRVGDVLPLSQARLAHEMLEGRPHKPGKIVLSIDS
ncbi:NADP-dependent oxidoreductase [Paraburkholderia sp.]|uniref:NADP-dependent oxidoreductase n=1 Tax=Paraburkholderia sp. TaxID=1926495 RepID=UPI0023834D02|nr:NADP-dependent oxidoreductase [Paraburkholderia sp.]MDE1182473.1 NADP-dependent oxidoreductase [Paraburkholderia sp.]